MSRAKDMDVCRFSTSSFMDQKLKKIPKASYTFNGKLQLLHTATKSLINTQQDLN